MAMSDHLVAEGLLKARLAAQLPTTRIYTLRDLATISESAQFVPSLHVVYNGETLADEAGRAEARVITQTWLVIVAVDSSVDPIASPATAAGTLIQSTINALAGYKLGAGLKECRRVNAPAPAYSGSFAYYPLAFEIDFIGG